MIGASPADMGMDRIPDHRWSARTHGSRPLCESSAPAVAADRRARCGGLDPRIAVRAAARKGPHHQRARHLPGGAHAVQHHAHHAGRVHLVAPAGRAARQTGRRRRPGRGPRAAATPPTWPTPSWPSPTSDSATIEITATNPDPERAAELADAFAEELQNSVREVLQSQIDDNRAVLTGQLAALQGQFDAARGRRFAGRPGATRRTRQGASTTSRARSPSSTPTRPTCSPSPACAPPSPSRPPRRS